MAKAIRTSLLALLMTTIFTCTACMPSKSENTMVIKPYHFENIQSDNLKRVLDHNIQLYEIKTKSKNQRMSVFVDVLDDGIMKRQALVEVSLSNNETNYLAIRTLGKGDFSIDLNGNESTVSLKDYLDWETEVKRSVLELPESIEDKVYLMYFVDDGKRVIDPYKLYEGKEKAGNNKLIVIGIDVLETKANEMFKP